MSAPIPTTPPDAARIEGVMLAADACMLQAQELMANHYRREQLHGFDQVRAQIKEVLTALRSVQGFTS
jgi:hypothetical protein